jgi:hypothetical protein
MAWKQFNWLEYDAVVGFEEQCNERPDSIRGKGFIHSFSDSLLLLVSVVVNRSLFSDISTAKYIIIALATEFINLVTNKYGAITSPKRYAKRRIFRNLIRQVNPQDHRVTEMQKRDLFWFVSVALPKQQEVTTGRCLLERYSLCKTSASSQAGNSAVEFQNEPSTNRNVTETAKSTGKVASSKHTTPLANHASSIITRTHLR